MDENIPSAPRPREREKSAETRDFSVARLCEADDVVVCDWSAKL